MRMSLSTTKLSNQSYIAIPIYLKIIILAQAATILSLTVWMYQEYLNDAYFQQYVISLLQTNIIADALLSMVTMSVFALGTFTLMGSMRSGRGESKEWRLLSDEAKAPSIPSLPVVDTGERGTRPRRKSSRAGRRKPRAAAHKRVDS